MPEKLSRAVTLSPGCAWDSCTVRVAGMDDQTALNLRALKLASEARQHPSDRLAMCSELYDAERDGVYSCELLAGHLGKHYVSYREGAGTGHSETVERTWNS